MLEEKKIEAQSVSSDEKPDVCPKDGGAHDWIEVGEVFGLVCERCQKCTKMRFV